MSAHLIPFIDLKNDSTVLREMREIFFESSSKKDFIDDAQKEAFYYKYLGIYLERYPELAWVAREEKVLGYVVASPVSDTEALLDVQPHLKAFLNYFPKYPAHLHINCHHDSRGKGIGGMLVKAVEKKLKFMNIQGLHIMTGSDALNRSFYQKLGFDFEGVELFHATPILFMGKSL